MQRTILVVEDDQAIRETFVEILESEGFAVATASNGQEGIEYLRSKPLPKLILLDLMMPVKDGFEFRAEQSGNPQWKAVPTVIMSADDRARQRMEGSGQVEYLRKPIELDALLAVVNRHCSS
jgi:CheY-like chemotaxis protein